MGAEDAAADEVKSQEEIERQDAHAAGGARENSLEVAIGREVRFFRRKLGMTIAELAKSADLSAGMLSRIENGHTSPSLKTVKALAAALQVPVTSLFRKYEEERDATYVKAGTGLTLERRGTRAGYQYQLLGHTIDKNVAVEPYLITLTTDSEVFPSFQHSGMEFIYCLEGSAIYRHASKDYLLCPGDSLFFDADAPHGPGELIDLPVKFISVIVYPRFEEG